MKIGWGSVLPICIVCFITTYLLRNVTLYDVVSYNPKLSVILVLLFVVFMLIVSICGYCSSIYFVDKHRYNQSERAKILTHRVYKVVWLMFYTGVILLFSDLTVIKTYKKYS